MSEGYDPGFRAFQDEWEAESAYWVTPEAARPGQLRVFKDKGGLIRIDIQLAEDDRQGPAEHVQIVVGQQNLLKRASDPQDPELQQQQPPRA